jgi:hypothetical protein
MGSGMKIVLKKPIIGIKTDAAKILLVMRTPIAISQGDSH